MATYGDQIKAEEHVQLQEMLQPHQEQEDEDEDVEEAVDIDVLTSPSNFLVRMASAGDKESIKTVQLMYELRELRNFGRVSGRAQQDLTALAQKLEMTLLEAHTCWIAFLAYDKDGSGDLDAEEIRQAMKVCAIELSSSAEKDFSVFSASKKGKMIGLEQYLTICKSCRTKSARMRTHLSSFYNHDVIQLPVAVLIVLNFLMIIVSAEFNPGGEENSLNDVINALELFFTIVFIIELGLNMLSFWFRPFWTNKWNVFDFIIVVGSITNLVPGGDTVCTHAHVCELV